MELLAHRGDTNHAIENTLEAFQSAYDRGADGVELDIRLTHDGVPVIYHNMMLGDQFIADLTLSELQAIELRSDQGWVSRVPSLVEVFDHFAGKMYLEMHLQSDTHETVNRVCHLIENYPQLNDMFELTSFEPAIINSVHSCNKAIPCDLLFRVVDWMSDEIALRLLIDKSRLCQPRGVHLFPYQITADVLSRFSRLGYVVHCGVTNDIETFERIRALGVSQILTDDLGLYLEAS